MASYSVDLDTPDDAYVAFWRERHLSTLTTLRPDGSPHVVPVCVTWDPEAGIARVITSGTSTKAALVRAAGDEGARVAVCQVDGRRWATLEGRARVREDRAAVAEAERRFTERYGREPRRTCCGSPWRSRWNARSGAAEEFRPRGRSADTPKYAQKLQRRHRVQVTVTPLRGEVPEAIFYDGGIASGTAGVAVVVLRSATSGSARRWSRWSRLTKIMPYRTAHRTGCGAPRACAGSGTPVRPRPRHG